MLAATVSYNPLRRIPAYYAAVPAFSHAAVYCCTKCNMFCAHVLCNCLSCRPMLHFQPQWASVVQFATLLSCCLNKHQSSHPQRHASADCSRYMYHNNPGKRITLRRSAQPQSFSCGCCHDETLVKLCYSDNFYVGKWASRSHGRLAAKVLLLSFGVTINTYNSCSTVLHNITAIPCPQTNAHVCTANDVSKPVEDTLVISLMTLLR